MSANIVSPVLPLILLRPNHEPTCDVTTLKKKRDNDTAREAAVVVLESPIHGHGLFAARDLTAGEILLRMNPDYFSNEAHHPWNTRNRDVLPFFINHSCDANVSILFSKSDRSFVLIAARAITKNTEITLDYFTIEIGGMLIPCCCGSDGCKGVFPVHR